VREVEVTVAAVDEAAGFFVGSSSQAQTIRIEDCTLRAAGASTTAAVLVDSFGSSNRDPARDAGPEEPTAASTYTFVPDVRISHSRLESLGRTSADGAADRFGTGRLTVGASEVVVGPGSPATGWDTILIGGSKLAGLLPVSAGRLAICAGVFDEGHTFFAETCP